MSTDLEHFFDFVYNQTVGWTKMMKETIRDEGYRSPHPIELYRSTDESNWGFRFSVMACNWKTLCRITVRKPITDVTKVPVDKNIDFMTEVQNYFSKVDTLELESAKHGSKEVDALIDLEVFSWKDRDNDGEPDNKQFNNLAIYKDDYHIVGSIAGFLAKMWRDEWREYCKAKDEDDD